MKIKLVKVVCARCGSIFECLPCHAKIKKFCNRACFRVKPVERKCRFCGKRFWSKPSAVRRGSGLYCSKQCVHSDRVLPPERFWKRVNKTQGCWIWTGGKDSAGYGQISVRRKKERTHRLAWLLTLGRIPKGMFVCHKCDNPSCVNPAHLFLGSNRDNMEDKIRKKRHVFGERTPNSKLTVGDVRFIRSCKSMTHVEMAKIFGVCSQTIDSVVNHKNWAHV